MGSDSIDLIHSERLTALLNFSMYVALTDLSHTWSYAVARQARFNLPGYPQHVIQRGNNRSVIFADDADYLFYLDKLKAACECFDCRIHAYILMTNHVHLLMTPATGTGIGKVMQFVGRCFVQYFSWRYQRTGTLWDGRYKASLLDTERYLLTCYRYIELNPVRAGMVDDPQHYRWSSHGYNAAGNADHLVIPHDLYLQLGPDVQRRCSAYRALFENSIVAKTLGAIRKATNGAWVIGNECFRNEVESLLQRQAAPKSKGGDRKSSSFREQQNINRV
jgi:putative transposase